MKKLFATKTFWAGAAAIVAAAGGYFTGEMSLADAVQTISTGLVGIFLRHGLITSASAK